MYSVDTPNCDLIYMSKRIRLKLYKTNPILKVISL